MCVDRYVRDSVNVLKVLGAMVGAGDRTLGLVSWGFILIPLVLLWIISWGVGSIAIWVWGGFFRR